MSIDTRWDEWLEGEDDLPISHRARITVDIELDMRLPPWTTADDALAECLSTIGSTEFRVVFCNEWSYDDPQFTMPESRVLGSLGTIEAVTS